jgi:hypothetical protein
MNGKRFPDSADYLFIASDSSTINSLIMKRIGFLLSLFIMTGINMLSAQSTSIPFNWDRWDTTGATVQRETYLGKEGILVKSGQIFCKDVDFLDGTLEADISFPQERNFPGIIFRMQDRQNYEEFYMRPHQSGNPDANQYTPVFNGNAGWQLYYGEGYGHPFKYRFNEWHHVKIVTHGITAEIYIDDMQKPLINVKELKRGWKAGKIGFETGAPVHFANLQYSKTTQSAPAAIPIPPNGKDGLVTQWQVSNVVSSQLFEKQYQLTPAIKSALTWTKYPTEYSGVINLSKYGKLSEKENTMVARLIIESDKDQVRPMSFGFSDYVLVYCNDKALYYGEDRFVSRDYRFLGTIGYYDVLPLALKKGTNEVWFVVGETFGGWGVQAKFPDMQGISIK